MTHISKQPLPRAKVQKLATQFVSFLKGASSAAIFSNFFTEAEQVMFIKRLAIILMLDYGYSKYRVAQTLKVSESTVKRQYVLYQAGHYDHLVAKAKTKSFNKKEFWGVVEVLLRAGLPPMVGKGRWQGLQPMVGTRKNTAINRSR